MSINVVLLAGGAGLRLWPVSNINHPKQFITLPQMNLSGFQLALTRALAITQAEKITIITNVSYQALLIQQFENINLDYNDFNIIFEHNSNGTGTAIYYSCCLLLQHEQDNLTYFFPTDHHIEADDDLLIDIEKQVDNNKINVLGELVTKICSNFGYLVAQKEIGEKYYSIEKFIEKPNSDQIKFIEKRAEKLYKNLGIYIAKPSILCQEFNKFYHDLLKIEFNLQSRKHYIESCYNKGSSIDKMISEKTSLLNMYEINFFWQDIGSFKSLYDYCNEEALYNCPVDSVDILKFNEENKDFSLEVNDKNIRIIKK